MVGGGGGGGWGNLRIGYGPNKLEGWKGGRTKVELCTVDTSVEVVVLMILLVIYILQLHMYCTVSYDNLVPYLKTEQKGKVWKFHEYVAMAHNFQTFKHSVVYELTYYLRSGDVHKHEYKTDCITIFKN